MYSLQPTQTEGQLRPPQQRLFQRVTVNLRGRLMLANYEEYECSISDMSPGDIVLTCTGRPFKGERVVIYIDHLGRLEGNVVDSGTSGFTMSINATDRKREKLAAQLTWIANKHELGLPEDRRHDRLTPRNVSTVLTLADGRRFPCRIVDLSLSGAAVDLEMRLPVGTPVRLGNMQGQIVRYFKEGMAIEFLAIQSRETLTEFL